MRFFLAGIMQGSQRDLTLHNQDYRTYLKQLLVAHLPDADVYDPLADHQNSVEYDEEKGRRVFLDHNALSGEVDVVIAVVPEASMGTAIEMWEAYRNGRIVIAISPLQHNWAVKFLSHELYPCIADFELALVSGRLVSRIEVLRAELCRSKIESRDRSSQ